MLKEGPERTHLESTSGLRCCRGSNDHARHAGPRSSHGHHTIAPIASMAHRHAAQTVETEGRKKSPRAHSIVPGHSTMSVVSRECQVKGVQRIVHTLQHEHCVHLEKLFETSNTRRLCATTCARWLAMTNCPQREYERHANPASARELRTSLSFLENGEVIPAMMPFICWVSACRSRQKFPAFRSSDDPGSCTTGRSGFFFLGTVLRRRCAVPLRSWLISSR